MKKIYMKVLLIISIALLLGLIINRVNLYSVKTGLDILLETSSVPVNKSSIDYIVINDHKEPEDKIKIVDKTEVETIVEVLSTAKYRYTKDDVYFKWYKEFKFPIRVTLYSNNEVVAVGLLDDAYIQPDGGKGGDKVYERIYDATGNPEAKILKFLE